MSIDSNETKIDLTTFRALAEEASIEEALKASGQAAQEAALKAQDLAEVNIRTIKKFFN